MPADVQIEKWQGFAVADEIASDFSDIALKYAKELLENEWLTLTQYRLFLEIDKRLAGMSKQKDLWSVEALRSADDWEECRAKGRELLKALGD
ncbi:hypothetical protein [Vagococcus allomyrinae]|nr:hypothetical protein [Vagococcus allomyrinae]